MSHLTSTDIGCIFSGNQRFFRTKNKYFPFFSDSTQLGAYVEGFDKDSTCLVPKGLNITEEDKLDEVAKQIKHFYLKEGTFTAHNRSLIKVQCTEYCCIRLNIISGFSTSATKDLLDHSWSMLSYIQNTAQYTFTSSLFMVFLVDRPPLQVSWCNLLGTLVCILLLFIAPGFSEDVVHGEELDFIMTRSYGGLNTTDLTKYPEMDQTVQKRMITFFTNFAKYL